MGSGPRSRPADPVCSVVRSSVTAWPGGTCRARIMTMQTAAVVFRCRPTGARHRMPISGCRATQIESMGAFGYIQRVRIRRTDSHDQKPAQPSTGPGSTVFGGSSCEAVVPHAVPGERTPSHRARKQMRPAFPTTCAGACTAHSDWTMRTPDNEGTAGVNSRALRSAAPSAAATHSDAALCARIRIRLQNNATGHA